MELYTTVAYAISRRITLDYSTSFSSSTKLFAKELQPHIYAIYGLVRIADEIVDTYRQPDALTVLNELEADVYTAIARGYSPNPVIHAFVQTAAAYGINEELIKPFYKSMAMDTDPVDYTKELYDQYIYGSAEVVGLMCLRVFIGGDEKQFKKLAPGAQALGAAYQKINFLRDMAADFAELGRIYFPGLSFESFNEDDKEQIIKDIEDDLGRAKIALEKLPPSSRRAVGLSVVYYGALLNKLRTTPVSVIKQKRVRINAAGKLLLLLRSKLGML